jgi:hypothetical protein
LRTADGQIEPVANILISLNVFYRTREPIVRNEEHAILAMDFVQIGMGRVPTISIHSSIITLAYILSLQCLSLLSPLSRFSVPPSWRSSMPETQFMEVCRREVALRLLTSRTEILLARTIISHSSTTSHLEAMEDV